MDLAYVRSQWPWSLRHVARPRARGAAVARRARVPAADPRVGDHHRRVQPRPRHVVRLRRRHPRIADLRAACDAPDGRRPRVLRRRADHGVGPGRVVGAGPGCGAGRRLRRRPEYRSSRRGLCSRPRGRHAGVPAGGWRKPLRAGLSGTSRLGPCCGRGIGGGGRHQRIASSPCQAIRCRAIRTTN